MKKTLIGLIAAAIVIAALAFVGIGGHQADNRQPAPAGDRTPAPEQTVAAPLQPQPAADSKPQTGRMELEPAARQAQAEPAADFSYSLKKDNKERTLVPGVTLSPEGQGVNIKLANKDETIAIRRNTTDPAYDYKVMWQKKF